VGINKEGRETRGGKCAYSQRYGTWTRDGSEIHGREENKISQSGTASAELAREAVAASSGKNGEG